jgi:feruloyl-CoA synthase
MTTPMRDPRYAPAELIVEERGGGEVVLHNPKPIGRVFEHTLGALDHWAGEAPERLWLAERSGEGWRGVTYGEARERVAALAGGLAALGLPPGAPLLVLARNSIDHALLAFAAMSLEIPAAAISPQYGLKGAQPERLAHAAAVIAPGAVFADDGEAFAEALDSPALSGLPVIVGANPRAGEVTVDWLSRQAPSHARPRADAIAKLLLTSGSTGRPKAVICLHSGVAVNAAQVAACYDDPEPPVVVNQAPWSHSLGANAILQMVLHRGGTHYIDTGAPVAGRSGETVRNLREIAPTYHNMVPAGWDLLAHHLEQDDLLARAFFSRVRVLQYGGAALGQSTCDRIQAVALRTVGETISFASGYGATETGPTVTNVHWPNARMGLMGLPLPGTTVKLTPMADRLEFRVKGPQISPGYYRDPEASARARDDEGFYRLGDAARAATLGDWRGGLVFDGRLSENFKLSSGVFVNAGALRVAATSAIGGAAADAVVCGEGESGVGLLIFAARGDTAALEDSVRDGLRRYNATAAGGSGRVARALILKGAPDPVSGEITEKGYINQTIARARHAADIARLFADPPGEGVIAL